MRSVSFTNAALRDLKRVPKAVQKRMIDKIRIAADDPPAAGEEKIVGSDDLYRVREGDYRIVYRRTREELLVAAIGHRRDVYARLRRR